MFSKDVLKMLIFNKEGNIKEEFCDLYDRYQENEWGKEWLNELQHAACELYQKEYLQE